MKIKNVIVISSSVNNYLCMCLDSVGDQPEALAFPTGGVTLLAGGVAVPSGGVAVPSGGVAVPSGGEAVPSGGVAVPSGGVAVPSRGVTLLAGGVAVPSEGIADTVHEDEDGPTSLTGLNTCC